MEYYLAIKWVRYWNQPHAYNHITEENNPKQTKTPNPTASELALYTY